MNLGYYINIMVDYYLETVCSLAVGWRSYVIN
ncbi:MAG: hypothetical protein K0S04_2387 [Herbinix sp.]|jgi:hypothetical protein|nr:hypothetical protein [Herbinix sp.]